MKPALAAAALLVPGSAAASPFSALPAGAAAPCAVTIVDAHDAERSTVVAIDDRGRLCGEAGNAAGTSGHGIIHTTAGLQEVVPPPPGRSRLSLLDLAGNGDAAGSADGEAFVRLGGTLIPLAPPGATSSRARGINDAGTVVGELSGPGGAAAWSWQAAGGFTPLPGLAGWPHHGATGINGPGAVIGWSTRPDPADPLLTQSAAWICTGGVCTPLTWPDTTQLAALAINDHGDILVRFRRPATGAVDRHGVLADGDLHEIILALPPGFSSPQLTGLNNSGEIAGQARDGTGRMRGLRARPAWLPELTDSHGDVAFTFSAGTFSTDVVDTDLGIVHRPDKVLVAADGAARRLIPQDPAFAFLGAAGASTWVLPQLQEPGLPWLGLSSLIAGGVLRGPLVVSLDSVSGPGHFSLYSVSGLGTPVVRMATGNGIDPAADRVTLNAGAHVHFNWAFSAPGLWTVRLRLRGTPSAGTAEIVSQPVPLTFWIAPGRVFPASLGTPQRTAGGIALPLTAEVGRECLLLASPDLASWETAARFLTTTRDFTVTAPDTASSRFFRFIVR